jgi:Na+/H+ antiporter NhaD/arsenite permease-like protein
MQWDFELAAGILILLYATVVTRQVLTRGPSLSILFLVAGGAMVLFGVISPQVALGSINFTIIAFLFAMFIFAVGLDRAGVLAHLASWLVSRGRNIETVPFYLFVGIGLVSAIVVNDALVLLGVPLILALSKRIGTPPVPLLLTMAFAVTVGSVMTPIGNPQNTLVALSSGISFPFATFGEYLVIPTIVNLIIGGWLMMKWFGPKLKSDAAKRLGDVERKPVHLFPFEPKEGWARWIRLNPSVLIFPATLGVMVVSDVGAALGRLPDYPIWAISLVGALLLLLVQPSSKELLNGVDWNTLLLFVGLFVVMGGVAAAGLFSSMGSIFPIPPASHAGSQPVAIGTVMVSSLFGSQLLSNVPWAALSIPLLSGLGYGVATPRVWMALAAGCTLAGNVTLLGAASNLIVVNRAEKEGVRIGFVDFLKYGLPLTVVMFGVVFGCLLVGI